MKFNIVRPGGGHAGIFVELAELLYFALQELGNEAIITVGEAKTGFQNIVIGIFHSEELWDSLPEASILINTEPLFAHEDLVRWSDKLIQLSSKFIIWDYDPGNLKVLADLEINNLKLFTFGYQKELERIPEYPDSERPIDVLFYGSSNRRREDVTDQISEKGLHFRTFFGVYGQARDENIARSKLVINSHFHENGAFEIVRIHYLLNNGVAIVPEIGPNTSIDASYLSCLVGVPYSGLVDRCIFLKENPDELLSLRSNALTEFKKTPQTTYMEELLKTI